MSNHLEHSESLFSWIQMKYFKALSVFCFLYQSTHTLIYSIQSRNVISETSPQYLLQSEMGQSNTQNSGIFKVIAIGNYTAVIF